ncbi:hypothetical protein G6F56_013367 [Rhizopus delemar]|nr:hypothetical protein G6F56_013367 [Rhizopus delemar]
MSLPTILRDPKKARSNMMEETGLNQEKQTKYSSPISKNTIWMPLPLLGADLKFVLECEGSEQDEEQLTDILEKIRRLSVYGYATGKRIDDEVKDISTKALRLPTSVKYLEDKDDSEKDLAFDDETVEKIQQASYEETILKRATTS